MYDTDSVSLYEFGPFTADTSARRLSRDGVSVALSSKAFDALVVLLKTPGETVTRDALFDAIWDDTTVEDNNLSQQISSLRKTLGESRGEHKFIATVPGKGYCFVAPVAVHSRRPPNENGTIRVSSTAKPFNTFFGAGNARQTGFAIAIIYITMVGMPFVYSAIRNAVNGNQPQTLAILQFKAGRGDEFIGTGISETLRARLGSVEDLTVRTGFDTLNDRDVVTAGRELRVDAIVTGSVQRVNNHIRITVEMVDVANGRVVWGKTFDDDVTNIFALQDSIAGEVASVLRVRLTAQIGSPFADKPARSIGDLL